MATFFRVRVTPVHVPIPNSEQLFNPTNYRSIFLLSTVSTWIVCTNSPTPAMKWKSTTGALLSATWLLRQKGCLLRITFRLGKGSKLPLLQTLNMTTYCQRSQFLVVNGERSNYLMSLPDLQLEYLRDLCLVLFPLSSILGWHNTTSTS